MANFSEPSSSLSFNSSSPLSNGSINHTLSTPWAAEAGQSLDMISLTKLSTHLEQLLRDSTCDYSDAEVVVDGVSVGVHRCILAVRSPFFQDKFKEGKGSSDKDGRPKYNMANLLPYGKVGYDAFSVFLSYLYSGKLRPPPMEVSACVNNVCNHQACRPAINFAAELMYASSIFQVPELISLFQRRLLNFLGKANVEDVVGILVVASHCGTTQLIDQCVERIARSDLDNTTIEKELPFEVAEQIKLLRKKSLTEDEQAALVTDPIREKRIRSIHKALDSDDVELVKLLLTESDITLNDANALHYAVAYCDAKVVTELLALGQADVNLRSSRDYTVLHVAAMRREPSVIISLLAKGACALDLTSDGQSAVSICRRLTRPKDYHTKTEQGQESNKYRICIDVLEREMRRNPMAGNASITPHSMNEDLHMKLLYLENRVAFARLFFPTEAKVAMDIANATTTAEFSGLTASKGSSGNLMEVDLNETPIMQNKRLRSRMLALMKTVETGCRYFPNCSEVIDKFMEDDLPDLFYLEKGTLDEQRIKRTRFVELKDDVQKAFTKDKAEINRSNLSSSSSSSSLKDGNNDSKVTGQASDPRQF